MFLSNALLVEKNFQTGQDFGMISPKRIFERELWVGKSVRRWSKMFHLQPNTRTTRRKI